MNEQKTKKDPKEQLKKLKDKAKSFWESQSKKKKTIMISSVVAIVVIAAVAVSLMNQPKYVVLYPQLSKDETLEVVEELKTREIDYKEVNGSIRVPAEKESSLRMELANAGHPKTSPSYDFFLDNVNMMTTSEERKIIEKYTLDQKLGKVIEEIDGIKSATVTITLPDTEGYVLSTDDSEEKATAGVSITMSSQGKELSGKQVKGIKKLVASSVPNLNEKDVTVVDTASGLELSDTNTTSTQKLDLTQFKFVVEKEFEQGVSKNVQKILEPLFGKSNVRVAVKSVIDIDKKIQEVITYNPSENNKGVISREQTQNEQQIKDGEIEAEGVPGTDTNTDEITTYPGVTKEGDTLYIKDNKTYEYLVSSVKEQVQRDSGDLKELTISVAVNRESISESRRIELSKLVANAAAVDSEKVVIYADTFSEDGTQTGADANNQQGSLFKKYPWLIYVVIGGSILLLALIVLSTMISRNRKQKLEEQGYLWQEGDPNDLDENGKKKKKRKGKKGEIEPELLQGSEQPQPFNIEDINLQEIKETKEQAMKREIIDFTTATPEITAQLVKTWLKGED